jgi:5-methylcytosine-specific restriction protein A
MCAGVPEGSCDQAAQDVDHKVPLRDGGTHHWSNLQALCHRCHSRKTAREDGRFGAVRRVFRGPAPPRRAAREGDLWVDDSTKPPTVYVYTKAGRIAPGWTRCDPMKGRRS